MNERVLGVLAGTDLPLTTLLRWAESADLLIAADSGADPLIEAGYSPIVVGDMDSTRNRDKLPADKYHYMPDPNSTDCDKLLSLAEKFGVKRLTLTAVEGDRFDHVLATLFSALRSALQVRFVFRQGIGEIIRGGKAKTFDTKPGRVLSLLPLVDSSGVFLSGVEWPLADATIHPAGLVSVSNRTNSDQVEVSVMNGAALLIVEHSVQEQPIW